MQGETDLQTMLCGLRPVLDPLPFGFGLVPLGAGEPGDLRAFARIEETEGATLIATAAALAAAGVAHAGGWARITLTVQSSLDAVGLTAAVATALAREGISANVVAAWYHDHLFVAWEDRHRAMTALEALSRSGIR